MHLAKHVAVPSWFDYRHRHNLPHYCYEIGLVGQSFVHLQNLLVGLCDFQIFDILIASIITRP
jgi:hypothetical protein